MAQELNTDGYRVLLEGGGGEIVEKKSRFIATLRNVQSEEEAVSFIAEMKKKYWDARHNCSAFVIGGQGELTRCSDDGEPAGTAGRPMLEVLQREKLHNAAVVVTRYFGGTLLGTGGLVRAYTQAVQEGLKHCRTGTMRFGYEILLETDYNFVGKIQYFLGQRGIEPFESSYSEKAVFRLRIPASEEQALHKALTEATNGRVMWIRSQELYYVEEE